MTTDKNTVYLAFGTRNKPPKDDSEEDYNGNKTTYGSPYKVYEISGLENGLAQAKFYRIFKIAGNDLSREPLTEGSYEFNKIRKWIGESSTKPRRNLLAMPDAKAVLNGFDDVLSLYGL